MQPFHFSKQYLYVHVAVMIVPSGSKDCNMPTGEQLCRHTEDLDNEMDEGLEDKGIVETLGPGHWGR